MARISRGALWSAATWRRFWELTTSAVGRIRPLAKMDTNRHEGEKGGGDHEWHGLRHSNDEALMTNNEGMRKPEFRTRLQDRFNGSTLQRFNTGEAIRAIRG
jgi:hypothetical protein